MTVSENFNPRAPYGARRSAHKPKSQRSAISIHAPHTGRDHHAQRSNHAGKNFNPRAPYGARLTAMASKPLGLWISIHAPHTGRD